MKINRGYCFSQYSIDDQYVIEVLFFDIDHLAHFFKGDVEVKIISSYINVFPNESESDEHYTEKDFVNLVSFSQIKSKIDSFYEYRIYELFFYIPSEKMKIKIKDDTICYFYATSFDKATEIAERCLGVIGYDKKLLNLITQNEGSYVTMNKEGKYEIFNDFYDMLDNDTLLD